MNFKLAARRIPASAARKTTVNGMVTLTLPLSGLRRFSHDALAAGKEKSPFFEADVEPGASGVTIRSPARRNRFPLLTEMNMGTLISVTK